MAEVTTTPLAGALIADFNIENLAGYLRNGGPPAIECKVGPYGQVTQLLLDDAQSLWESALDFLVVWTRPEAILESVGRALSGAGCDADAMKREVDAYCATLLSNRRRARVTFVPIWVLPSVHHGHGLLDLHRETGVSRLILQANLRLLENLDGPSNVIPLNTGTWVEKAGAKSFNPRLWYTAKVPYGNELFKAAAQDIRAALTGIIGHSRKLVIVDLDDTCGAVWSATWVGRTWYSAGTARLAKRSSTFSES